WIAIDTFKAGDYLPYRPFLKGMAGMEAEYPDPEDKVGVEAYKKSAKSRVPAIVEVSLDDGRSFLPAKGTSEWSFRMETLDYSEGDIHAIVRATFPDGSIALAKSLLFLDKTPPTLRVITPAEGGRFNGVLALSGTAMDETGLEFVGVALRKGDKASYQVPSFIQGIYLDTHLLGSTLWEVGVGLSFFDDNVKLQGHFGQAPETDDEGAQQSFYGDVFGAKLIANLGVLPFNSLFGPDWDFLSASIGLGANFTYFTKTQAGSGLLVGAVFGQIEFPKVTLKNVAMFKKYSFYTEAQVWVLSSVVSGGFIPRMSFGIRLGVF
ncbi:MAG: hypothetical protein Q8M76_13975, partial [Spirochaetaceae bacterium]|nr:hypothetical protein [Spirochaetaceae bacterium]